MPNPPSSLLSYLRVVAAAWRNDPRNDAELLARFAESQDEAAFATLVGRHGPLVWQTCRRVLGNTSDAEDAFQVAFLALARKASRVTIASVAGWLHRVARQAAMDVRSKSRRSQDLEQRLQILSKPEVEESLGRTEELYAALDEELAGLPERLRIPLVLRYLEGKTLEDVARIVGCCRRVLGKRLARGEAILRENLKQRGLTVGVGSVAALLTSSATVSAVPPLLIGSTVRAAMAFRFGTLRGGVTEGARVMLRSLSFPPHFESSETATLAEEMLKTMLLMTKKKIVAVLLGLTLCLAGGGLVAYQALVGNAVEPPQPASELKGETETSGQPRVAARVDYFGDPLPAGALARMGTTRLWCSRGWSGVGAALAFSPDGKTLATRIDGTTVCLWDAATGKEIRRLTTKVVKGGIHSLGFSRDGKTLVTVDWDQTVCQWEVATGKFLCKQEYQGPKRDNVQSLKVAFLPGGKMLGFGDFLKSAKEERKNKVGRSIEGRGKSAEEGRGAFVWDVATGKEICQLSEQMKRENWIVVKAFSPDGKLLATALEAERIKLEKQTILSLWDVATGKEIRQLIYRGEEGINTVAFSLRGKTLASANDEKICVWEVATGKKIHQLKGRGDLLTYSPDGKTLFGGARWGGGHLWDVGTGKEIRSFGWDRAVAALFSPDGKTLAVGGETGAIRLWEMATGKEIGPQKGYRGHIKSVAYSPDGKTLASMGEDGTVRLWETVSGKEMRPLAKHRTGWGGDSFLAYSPDGRILASSDNRDIHLWDTVTGKEIRQFTDRERNAKSAAFSPDGKRLAATYSVAKNDKTIRLWEVATGKVIYQWPAHDNDLCHRSSLAFSPDGRLLAAPGKENTVSLWEVATGKPVRRLGVPEQSPPGAVEGVIVLFLAFSPDGRMLATSNNWSHKIRLLEVASGKEIRQLGDLKNPGLRDGCTLAFSTDGRMLATAAQGRNPIDGSFDPKVHLWEVASGKEIGQLAGHQAQVQTLAFSPDGKTMTSGSDDITCLVWDIASFAGQVKPAPVRSLPTQALSKEKLEAAWTDLAKDPARAYAAISVLQTVPGQAIPLLRTRVRSAAPVADPQQLKRWIADLDAESFTVRDQARREITKLGEAALPALRQALKGQPSVEARRQLKDLLAELEPQVVVVSPERIRELRAVQVLESIGTAEARQVLQAWAKGVSEASLTQETQAALARMAKRSAVRP